MKLSALLLVVAAASSLSGCVSSKYKMAKTEDLTRPVVLSLVGKQSFLEATVRSVVIYQGPGSWKREAFWDEYVLSIANRGDSSLVIESATLMDFQGNANVAGADPWKLESESRAWWDNFKSSQAGSLVAIGAGTVGLSAAFLSASLVASGGFLGPATAASSLFASAALATAVVAPVYAVSIIVINSNNKKKVVEEFDRRRLVLPATLAPGAAVQGSLFFRISPGPQRLTLLGRQGGLRSELIIDLTTVGGMHLKAQPPSVQSKPLPMDDSARKSKDFADELGVLDGLLAAKTITPEEYQKMRAALVDKYRE